MLKWSDVFYLWCVQAAGGVLYQALLYLFEGSTDWIGFREFVYAGGLTLLLAKIVLDTKSSNN